VKLLFFLNEIAKVEMVVVATPNLIDGCHGWDVQRQFDLEVFDVDRYESFDAFVVFQKELSNPGVLLSNRECQLNLGNRFILVTVAEAQFG
jgi:hypothetical protein